MRNWKLFFLRITICVSILVGVVTGTLFHDAESNSSTTDVEHVLLLGFGFFYGCAAVWIFYAMVRWVYSSLYK